MFKPRPSRSLRLALGVVLPLLVVVVGACGGSSSPKVSTATSTTGANAAGNGGGAAGFAAFRDCLKQHGVDLGSGTPGGGSLPSGGAPPSGGIPSGGFPGGGAGGTPNSLPKGVTQSQFAAAQKACASKQPSGGFGGPGGGQGANAAYVGCLRDHGVTIPGGSSQTTAAGATTSRPSFDPSDPKFAAANKVCRVLLQNGSTTTTAG